MPNHLSYTTEHMPDWSRRVFLSSGVIVGATGVAGCASINPLACPDRNEVVIEATRADLSKQEKESIDPIWFSDLPPAQQAIAKTAVETGEYRVCPFAEADNTQAITDFAHTATERTGGGDGLVYLEYGGEYYELNIRIQDQVYA